MAICSMQSWISWRYSQQHNPLGWTQMGLDTYACSCVRASPKHCSFTVGVHFARVAQGYQAANTLCFDQTLHNMVTTKGVRACLSRNVDHGRYATMGCTA